MRQSNTVRSNTALLTILLLTLHASCGWAQQGSEIERIMKSLERVAKRPYQQRRDSEGSSVLIFKQLSTLRLKSPLNPYESKESWRNEFTTFTRLVVELRTQADPIIVSEDFKTKTRKDYRENREKFHKYYEEHVQKDPVLRNFTEENLLYRLLWSSLRVYSTDKEQWEKARGGSFFFVFCKPKG
jgi:hypothetical protein